MNRNRRGHHQDTKTPRSAKTKGSRKGAETQRTATDSTTKNTKNTKLGVDKGAGLGVGVLMTV